MTRRRLTSLLIALLSCTALNVAIAQPRVDVNGHVWHNTSPLCALVLANGQSTFSCNPDGPFEIPQAPLDASGQIEVQIFAAGFAPFKKKLTPSGSSLAVSLPQVDMVRVQNGSELQLFENYSSAGSGGLVRVSGSVTSAGTPICSLVLANGRKEFTCNESLGKFSLDVPRDAQGKVTLMAFAGGFQPFRAVTTVDASGAIVGDWVQLGTDIDGEVADDRAGTAVAINADGSVVAIGSTAHDGTALNAGHVRVFEWRDSAWVQRGKSIDGEGYRDGSGSSVSLSALGDVVAIGAPINSDREEWAGHVRVYTWNGAKWMQRGADIDGEGYRDQSGSSVSLSHKGDIVAIGAPYNSDSGDFAGHTRVFEWNGSTWQQRGSDIDGEAAGDNSGTSVSLSGSGDTLAIGAPGNSGGGLTLAGHTRVYSWNGSAWVRKGTDLDGEDHLNDSGVSVSLSSNGNVLAIGAHNNSATCCSLRHGHTRVYAWNGSQWIQRGADIDGENTHDASGFSVSLSAGGGVVAIAAPFNGDNGENSGQTRVYSWNGAQWVKVGDDINGEASGDWSGWKNNAIALSADGKSVIIGALQNDGNGAESGHARVYGLKAAVQ